MENKTWVLDDIMTTVCQKTIDNKNNFFKEKFSPVKVRSGQVNRDLWIDLKNFQWSHRLYCNQVNRQG